MTQIAAPDTSKLKMPNAKLPLDESQAEMLQRVLRAVQQQGGSAADVVLASSEDLTMGLRLGKLEKCEQASSTRLSLRVFVGQPKGYQVASVTTNDLRTLDVADFAARAIAMAKLAPADEFAGLAAPEELAQHDVPVDSADENFTLDAVALQARAAALEGAMLGVPGIVNSEGAECSAARTRTTLMTSNGFAASRVFTSTSQQAVAIAGDNGGGMVMDYDHRSAVYESDLPAAAAFGQAIAASALKQCGAVKLPSMHDVSVVVCPDVAREWLSEFLAAINGDAISQGRSYLCGKLGQQIFAPSIMILSEPHLPRGLRSRPFDAEGLATRPRALVEGGMLQGYLLDLRAARKLGMAPTADAVRGGISASNITLLGGTQTPADLMRDIKRGIYITRTMGHGGNMQTGDYSVGITGFLIENGTLTQPIKEMTVAGTLPQIFARAVAANDLQRTHGVDAPTLRVDGMTIAGA